MIIIYDHTIGGMREWGIQWGHDVKTLSIILLQILSSHTLCKDTSAFVLTLTYFMRSHTLAQKHSAVGTSHSLGLIGLSGITTLCILLSKVNNTIYRLSAVGL